jgi:hypothetical protein
MDTGNTQLKLKKRAKLNSRIPRHESQGPPTVLRGQDISAAKYVNLQLCLSCVTSGTCTRRQALVPLRGYSIHPLHPWFQILFSHSGGNWTAVSTTPNNNEEITIPLGNTFTINTRRISLSLLNFHSTVIRDRTIERDSSGEFTLSSTMGRRQTSNTENPSSDLEERDNPRDVVNCTVQLSRFTSWLWIHCIISNWRADSSYGQMRRVESLSRMNILGFWTNSMPIRIIFNERMLSGTLHFTIMEEFIWIWIWYDARRWGWW